MQAMTVADHAKVWKVYADIEARIYTPRSNGPSGMNVTENAFTSLES